MKHKCVYTGPGRAWEGIEGERLVFYSTTSQDTNFMSHTPSQLWNIINTHSHKQTSVLSCVLVASEATSCSGQNRTRSVVSKTVLSLFSTPANTELPLVSHGATCPQTSILKKKWVPAGVYQSLCGTTHSPPTTDPHWI